MIDLGWILAFGFGMSAIALVGGFAAVLSKRTLEALSLPAVAFAAGSLIGGAVFHMLPGAVAAESYGLGTWVWFAGGFVAFLLLENVLQWHHCHQVEHDHRLPLRWMILAADGVHNLIGGLSIGAMFSTDPGLGVAAWTAAAMHEVPQEIGDFGVLVFSGLSVRRALVYNLISALTFPIGMVIAWSVAGAVDISFLVPFGAGNFVYIAAADLIPEVKRTVGSSRAWVHLVCFGVGLGAMLVLRLLLHPGGW